MPLTDRELNEARNIARKVSHRPHTEIAVILNERMRLRKADRFDWRDIGGLLSCD